MSDRITGVIDKLGSYVHLDLGYYVRNFSYVTVANFVTAGFSILLSIAFARLLTKDLYGQWNYIFSIIGILAILGLPGINIGIKQAVARGHDRVLIEGTKEKFKWSILGSLALVGVGAYYFVSGSTLLGKCLMISSLFFPFFENLQAYNAFLAGKKQFGRSARYGVITQIISISATIGVIYFTRDLIIILITYLVSFSLMRGYFFLATAKTLENAGDDKGALTFGKKMTGLEVMGVITTYGDKIILGIMLGFSDLAIYTIARGFEGIIRGLLKPVADLSFPKLAALGEREAYSAVKKRYLYLVLVTVVAAGISIALCPFIITLFYSQQYADSVLYAQILVAALIFGIPTSIFNRALFPAQKKVKEVYKLEIARVVLHTALFIGLVLVLGLLGLVLAKLITGALIMIYAWWQAGWIRPRPSANPS